jgi:hypothetical protein
MLGVIRQQLAAELERILADCVGKLIHEAFEVDGIMIVVYAAPEVRRDMRVSHGMVNQQVRDRVTEHAFRPTGVETLEHKRILAVLQALRIDEGKD